MVLTPKSPNDPILKPYTSPSDQKPSKGHLTANPMTKPLKEFQRTAIVFIIFFLIMAFQTFYSWFGVSEYADSSTYVFSGIYSVLCINLGFIALLLKKKIVTSLPEKQWWQRYGQISICIQFIGLLYHAQ
jgi:hypothetical protein